MVQIRCNSGESYKHSNTGSGHIRPSQECLLAFEYVNNNFEQHMSLSSTESANTNVLYDYPQKALRGVRQKQVENNDLHT